MNLYQNYSHINQNSPSHNKNNMNNKYDNDEINE